MAFQRQQPQPQPQPQPLTSLDNQDDEYQLWLDYAAAESAQADAATRPQEQTPVPITSNTAPSPAAAARLSGPPTPSKRFSTDSRASLASNSSNIRRSGAVKRISRSSMSPPLGYDGSPGSKFRVAPSVKRYQLEDVPPPNTAPVATWYAPEGVHQMPPGVASWQIHPNSPNPYTSVHEGYPSSPPTQYQPLPTDVSPPSLKSQPDTVDQSATIPTTSLPSYQPTSVPPIPPAAGMQSSREPTTSIGQVESMNVATPPAERPHPRLQTQNLDNLRKEPPQGAPKYTLSSLPDTPFQSTPSSTDNMSPIISDKYRQETERSIAQLVGVSTLPPTQQVRMQAGEYGATQTSSPMETSYTPSDTTSFSTFDGSSREASMDVPPAGSNRSQRDIAPLNIVRKPSSDALPIRHGALSDITDRTEENTVETQSEDNDSVQRHSPASPRSPESPQSSESPESPESSDDHLETMQNTPRAQPSQIDLPRHSSTDVDRSLDLPIRAPFHSTTPLTTPPIAYPDRAGSPTEYPFSLPPESLAEYTEPPHSPSEEDAQRIVESYQPMKGLRVVNAASDSSESPPSSPQAPQAPFVSHVRDKSLPPVPPTKESPLVNQTAPFADIVENEQGYTSVPASVRERFLQSQSGPSSESQSLSSTSATRNGTAESTVPVNSSPQFVRNIAADAVIRSSPKQSPISSRASTPEPGSNLVSRNAASSSRSATPTTSSPLVVRNATPPPPLAKAPSRPLTSDPMSSSAVGSSQALGGRSTEPVESTPSSQPSSASTASIAAATAAAAAGAATLAARQSPPSSPEQALQALRTKQVAQQPTFSNQPSADRTDDFRQRGPDSQQDRQRPASRTEAMPPGSALVGFRQGPSDYGRPLAMQQPTPQVGEVQPPYEQAGRPSWDRNPSNLELSRPFAGAVPRQSEEYSRPATSQTVLAPTLSEDSEEKWDIFMTEKEAKDLLVGHVVMITGAGAGTGRDVALELGAKGARLSLSSQSRPLLDEVSGAVQKLGRNQKTLVYGGNLREERDFAKVIEGTEKKLGPIDVLVNVWEADDGGISSPVDAESRFDFKATLLTTSAILPKLMDNDRGGRIINVVDDPETSQSSRMVCKFTASLNEQMAHTRYQSSSSKRTSKPVVPRSEDALPGIKVFAIRSQHAAETIPFIASGRLDRFSGQLLPTPFAICILPPPGRTGSMASRTSQKASKVKKFFNFKFGRGEKKATVEDLNPPERVRQRLVKSPINEDRRGVSLDGGPRHRSNQSVGAVSMLNMPTQREEMAYDQPQRSRQTSEISPMHSRQTTQGAMMSRSQNQSLQSLPEEEYDTRPPPSNSGYVPTRPPPDAFLPQSRPPPFSESARPPPGTIAEFMQQGSRRPQESSASAMRPPLVSQNSGGPVAMNMGLPPVGNPGGSAWRPPPGWQQSEDNIRPPMMMRVSEDGMRPMMVPPPSHGPMPTRPSLDPRLSEISVASRPTTRPSLDPRVSEISAASRQTTRPSLDPRVSEISAASRPAPRGPIQSSMGPLQRPPTESRPSNGPIRPPTSDSRKPEEWTETSSRPSTASSKPEQGLPFGLGHASPREPIARPPIVNRPSSRAQSIPGLTEFDKSPSRSGQILHNDQAPPRPHQRQQQQQPGSLPQGRPTPRDVAHLQQREGDSNQRLNSSQGRPGGLGLTTGVPHDQEDESPVTTERIQGFPAPPMRDREPAPQQYFPAPRQQSQQPPPGRYVDEYEPPYPNRRQSRYEDAYDGYNGYDEPQSYAAYASRGRGRGYPQGIPPLRPLAPTADVNGLLGRQEGPVDHGGPPPLGSARGRSWIRGRFSRQSK